MQTSFSIAQLADPDIAASNDILRACVHCGFCTATCPTYVLLGDELDSPRGRIYLIKDMLEGGKPASARVVKHVDRCLSCLACMTTCPSGVNYMHLVDHGRRHIEETYRRPWSQRAMRTLLAATLPRPGLVRWAMPCLKLARALRGWLPRRLRDMIELTPRAAPAFAGPLPARVVAAQGRRRARVALLTGCVQQNLSPQINDATVRLLTRLGVEVVIAQGAGCCGALAHHLGKGPPSVRQIKANIDAWSRVLDAGGLDAVVANASGCGTMLKDYGFILRDDPAYADKAIRIASLTRDITELLCELGLGDATPPRPARPVRPVRVAYQSACSMQHGQGLTTQPQALLRAAGFTVVEPAEAHLCCGSAGTYNILQPAIAGELRGRKAAHLSATGAEVIASGNIGCITQLAGATDIPIVHTVELLDWATGGPPPPALAAIG